MSNKKTTKTITKNAVTNKLVDQAELRKPPYVEASFVEKIKKHKESNSKKPLRTHSRRSTITPSIIGITVEVHNGKSFTPRLITEDMVGRKLGEFAPTRTFKAHAKSKDGKK